MKKAIFAVLGVLGLVGAGIAVKYVLDEKAAEDAEDDWSYVED